MKKSTQPPQPEHLDGEEVTLDHRARLLAQELAPAGAAASRSRVDAGSAACSNAGCATALRNEAMTRTPQQEKARCRTSDHLPARLQYRAGVRLT
jgi:hypothetical protein